MIDGIERDIHVLKYFSSFISVSAGRVINVTDPSLSACPLASHLYKGFRGMAYADKEAIKREIARAIESKIRDYGFFTPQRKLLSGDTAIPCGASEILMFALAEKVIDAAVVVCDGAGTVITKRADVAQGIGSRMNSLLSTSPIKEIISRLKRLGCHIVSNNALIDQARGVERAIEAGYRKIAVTVAGHDWEKLTAIRRQEASGGSEVVILVVCTTGVNGDALGAISRDADIVWSCASEEIREKIGAKALLQISRQIPVFVLTEKGMRLAASYAQDNAILSGLDKTKQYLISNESGGWKVRLGTYNYFLREEKLPVLSGKGPVGAA